MQQPLAMRSHKGLWLPGSRNIESWAAQVWDGVCGGEVCGGRSEGFVKGFGTWCENGWVLGEKWGKRADFWLKMRLFGGFVFTT